MLIWWNLAKVFQKFEEGRVECYKKIFEWTIKKVIWHWTKDYFIICKVNQLSKIKFNLLTYLIYSSFFYRHLFDLCHSIHLSSKSSRNRMALVSFTRFYQFNTQLYVSKYQSQRRYFAYDIFFQYHCEHLCFTFKLAFN